MGIPPNSMLIFSSVCVGILVWFCALRGLLLRDLGGNLDTTRRGWSYTLSAHVRLVISRLALIFVLPLHFHGRVRVVRAMFIPCALHGAEASYLPKGSFLKLRAATLRAVRSRQPLAGVGAVLGLLVGLRVVILPFAWFGSGSGCSGGTHLSGLGSCPGHDLVHALVAGAGRLGFQWDPSMLRWKREGLLGLSNLAGLIQHFRSAVLFAWR